MSIRGPDIYNLGKHIFKADTEYGLGTADPNKIELVKIGYDQDVFV
jgi:hypothetical protein